MNVKQAIGGQSAEAKPKPEMWVIMAESGDVSFKLRHTPRKISRKFGKSKIAALEGKPNLEQLAAYLESLTGEYDQLTMALVRPAEKTAFEDIIGLMDVFRKQGIEDLGVTPL